MKLIGLSGSLRKASLNTALLRAAVDLVPSGCTLECCTLHGIPLYDGDLEAKGIPETVTALADRLADADAVVISSPEYNYSIPGVLKNGLDWVSRVKSQPLKRKPLAIMGASPGRFGTARMQYQLRHALLFTDADILAKPELMVGNANSVFDDNLILTDATTRDFIAKFLEALADRVRS